MKRRWHVLADLVNQHGLTAGAEIGVAKGRFTTGLLALCPDLKLWAVDSFQPGYKTWMGTEWTAAMQDVNKSRFLDVVEEYAPRVSFIEKPSLEAAAFLEDASLDFVFIDADHSYEAVRADIAAWTPKIRDGGWITGHDHDPQKFPGVVKAVEESFSEFFLAEDFVWIAQV